MISPPQIQTYFFIISFIKLPIEVSQYVIIIYFFVYLVISQVYNAELTPNEYVMKGNSGIMKCLIPSFVADFVEVTGWVDDGGSEYINDKKFDSGTSR